MIVPLTRIRSSRCRCRCRYMVSISILHFICILPFGFGTPITYKSKCVSSIAATNYQLIADGADGKMRQYISKNKMSYFSIYCLSKNEFINQINLSLYFTIPSHNKFRIRESYPRVKPMKKCE
jgi:hypothetical protein